MKSPPLLLEKGVELDVYAASMAGATDTVLEMIGDDPELAGSYSSDGWTPLHLACFFGQPADRGGFDRARRRRECTVAQSHAEHTAARRGRRT